MSIWSNKPLEHIIVPKPLIIPQEQEFYNLTRCRNTKTTFLPQR